MRISDFSLVPSCLVVGTAIGVDTGVCLVVSWRDRQESATLALEALKQRGCVGGNESS